MFSASLTPTARAFCLQVKNVGSDVLEGKVGRIYMPKQDVDGMALAKPKGVKRERRQVAADKAADKQQGGGGGTGGGSSIGQGGAAPSWDQFCETVPHFQEGAQLWRRF